MRAAIPATARTARLAKCGAVAISFVVLSGRAVLGQLPVGQWRYLGVQELF